jgi:UDP-N-acetyl-D-glucosamine dehydrogenase
MSTTCANPYVPSFEEDGERLESVALADDALKSSDAIVIITDHTSIDYQRLVNRAALIVDTRNATARTTPGRARVVSLSAGSAPDLKNRVAPAVGKVVA